MSASSGRSLAGETPAPLRLCVLARASVRNSGLKFIVLTRRPRLCDVTRAIPRAKRLPTWPQDSLRPKAVTGRTRQSACKPLHRDTRDSMLDLFRRGEILPEGRTNDEETKLILDEEVKRIRTAAASPKAESPG